MPDELLPELGNRQASLSILDGERMSDIRMDQPVIRNEEARD